MEKINARTAPQRSTVSQHGKPDSDHPPRVGTDAGSGAVDLFAGYIRLRISVSRRGKIFFEIVERISVTRYIAENILAGRCRPEQAFNNTLNPAT
jgi:hypothetical protein